MTSEIDKLKHFHVTAELEEEAYEEMKNNGKYL